MYDFFYIIYTLIAFGIFFIGAIDIFVLQDKTRVGVMFISFILFVFLALSSFNIEQTFCEYSSGWQCTTNTSNTPSMAVLNVMFALLSLLYVLPSALSLMPKV